MAEICTVGMFPTKEELKKLFASFSMPVIPSLDEIKQKLADELGRLPTDEEIRARFEKLIADFDIPLPSLPTFPKPFFGSINAPEFAIEHWIQEAMQNLQLAVIKALTDAVKGIMDIFAPLKALSIPSWDGLSFGDIVDGNVKKITDAVKAKLDSLQPIFGNIKAPDIEIWHEVQNIFVSAMQAVLNKLTTLIQPILDIVNAKPFQIGLGLPTIPTLPTLAEIKLKLKDAIKIGTFSWPGFPDITLPPLPKMSAPDMDIEKMASGIITELMQSLIKPWVNLVQQIVDSVGGALGLSFPKPHMCVNNGSFYIKVQ